MADTDTEPRQPLPSQLTEKQKQTARKKLTAKRALRPCPTCGHQSWTIGDHLVLLPLIGFDGTFTIGTGYAVIVVTCDNCSFFRSHGAADLGVVKIQADGEMKREGDDGK